MRVIPVLAAAVICPCAASAAHAESQFCGGAITEDRNGIFVGDDITDNNAPVCVALPNAQPWKQLHKHCAETCYFYAILEPNNQRKVGTKIEFHIRRIVKFSDMNFYALEPLTRSR